MKTVTLPLHLPGLLTLSQVGTQYALLLLEHPLEVLSQRYSFPQSRIRLLLSVYAAKTIVKYSCVRVSLESDV